MKKTATEKSLDRGLTLARLRTYLQRVQSIDKDQLDGFWKERYPNDSAYRAEWFPFRIAEAGYLLRLNDQDAQAFLDFVMKDA